MPVNTNFQIPFIPQTGITEQILSAIQMANEAHARQQQLGLQQQQVGMQQQALPGEMALRQAQTGLAGAQTDEAQQNIKLQQMQQQMRQREMEYVFGAGTGGGSQPDANGQTGPTEQKPGLFSDAQETKKRLKLSDEESAQFDAALKNVQVGFLSKGQLDMSPVDKVIQDHLAAQNHKDTLLHPNFRQEGDQWFQDMHTAQGKLAYSVPIPPPSEYLAKATEGVDYMRTVDAQTGKVTITPIQTQKVTTPVLPGTKVPKPQMAGGGAPFELSGAGKKLSEAGQATVTGLTQATSLADNALATLERSKPDWVDWQKSRLEYAAGMKPSNPDMAEAMQAIGILRAQATGPLLHGIKNASIIRGIQDHLPNNSDSPELIKQKLNDLKPFWKQAMQDVFKTENVTAPKEEAKPTADPLGIR